MTKFAHVRDGVVVETIELADDADIGTFFPLDQMQWARAGAEVEQGWEFQDPHFSAPLVAQPSDPGAAVRSQRNALLAASDWTQLPDVPKDTKARFAPYRAALRDVPQQVGFPTDVKWPATPQ